MNISSYSPRTENKQYTEEFQHLVFHHFIASLIRMLGNNYNRIQLIWSQIRISFTKKNAEYFSINRIWSTPTSCTTNLLATLLILPLLLFYSIHKSSMAPSFRCVLVLFVSVLSALNVATAATCSDCFIHSRAAYYPNSDEKGTESKILNCEHMSCAQTCAST